MCVAVPASCVPQPQVVSLLLNRLDCGREACIRWFSGPHGEGVSFLLDVLGAGTRPSRHPALQLLRLCLEHAGATLIAAGSDSRSKRTAVATLQLVFDFVVWGWYVAAVVVPAARCPRLAPDACAASSHPHQP